MQEEKVHLRKKGREGKSDPIEPLLFVESEDFDRIWNHGDIDLVEGDLFPIPEIGICFEAKILVFVPDCHKKRAVEFCLGFSFALKEREKDGLGKVFQEIRARSLKSHEKSFFAESLDAYPIEREQTFLGGYGVFEEVKKFFMRAVAVQRESVLPGDFILRSGDIYPIRPAVIAQMKKIVKPIRGDFDAVRTGKLGFSFCVNPGQPFKEDLSDGKASERRSDIVRVKRGNIPFLKVNMELVSSERDSLLKAA